ncbi:hypothetical protein [Streptomyces sp. NBC_00557]|uniref:hypothetical protein n=1 Tax=Streptomyces sp. NBC_00557 TaxID=2975776 RepID=UPI002E7FF6FD|nr:hypothetical protein [Streptomyces sp. NBC_00557]WUC35283.1 hypothetical protein OG956_14140 [Streptomyces sp. NBC_00557]
MTSTQATDHAWSPRPPRSALRLWTRYCLQWVWGPPLWLLTRLPLLVLILLEVDDLPSSNRGLTRPRWWRRMWIDLDRLRRERVTDPHVQEQGLRRMLDHQRLRCVPVQPEGAPPIPCPGGVHSVVIEQSYYRILGARRAYEIAHGEYGWRLAENAERHLPTWLELRCPGTENRDR